MKIYIVNQEHEHHEYGYGGWTGNTWPIVEVVAVFASENLAKEYVEEQEAKELIIRKRNKRGHDNKYFSYESFYLHK